MEPSGRSAAEEQRKKNGQHREVRSLNIGLNLTRESLYEPTQALRPASIYILLRIPGSTPRDKENEVFANFHDPIGDLECAKHGSKITMTEF